MPDEAQIGTDALRRTVSLARANAATAVAAPALPPDQNAAPWASPLPPEPDNTTTARAQATRQSRESPGPLSPSRAPKRKPPPPEFSRQKKAWDLVDRLMSNWSEDSKTSLAKANNLLSQRLARNGITIIREGIGIGQIADLVRLCNELARDAKGEGDEDPRITKMQEELKRDIPDLVIDDEPPTEDEGEPDDAA